MNSKRIGWIVSLRALAAMVVVLVHVPFGWLDPIGGGWDVLTGPRLILDKFCITILSKWAVPCFLMISGFLLLNPEKEVNLSKAMRYAMRMVLVLFTFGLFYCLIETVVTNGFSDPVGAILVSVKNLFEGKSWDIMWYVYMILGLYLLTPMLRVFVRAADSATAGATLAVLFVFTIIRPTIDFMFNLELAEILPVEAPFLLYYLAGYYLGRVHPSKGVRMSAFLVGSVGFIAMLLIEWRGKRGEVGYNNFFVALYSMTIFASSMNSRILERLSRNALVCGFSKYSFGIYLLHIFFLNLFMKGFGLFPDILPVGIGEFVFFAIALAGAFVATWILCRIKPMRKLLL